MYYRALITVSKNRMVEGAVSKVNENLFTVAYGEEEMFTVKELSLVEAKATVTTLRDRSGKAITANQPYWERQVALYNENPEYFD